MQTQLKLMYSFIAVLLILSTGCKKTSEFRPRNTETAFASSANVTGATQISGIGFFDATDECSSSSQGAAYALKMTGDFEGCYYTYVDAFKCSPSGAYYEKGREYFIGTFKGQTGSFWTTYNFEAKYEGCAPDGSYLGNEIRGRCQHPIVNGSGQGVFAGVTGRLEFKDDIEAANYVYRGHLRF